MKRSDQDLDQSLEYKKELSVLDQCCVNITFKPKFGPVEFVTIEGSVFGNELPVLNLQLPSKWSSIYKGPGLKHTRVTCSSIPYPFKLYKNSSGLFVTPYTWDETEHLLKTKSPKMFKVERQDIQRVTDYYCAEDWSDEETDTGPRGPLFAEWNK